MNMITRNMNNIKNNVITNVANIWNMKDTREDTRAILSHVLDKIRNPSEALNIYGPLRFFSFDQGFWRR